MIKKLKVGDYFPNLDREVWTVRLEDTDVGESYFDCKTQFEAEVLSRLVKLSRTKVKLEKVKRVQNKILKILDDFVGDNIRPNSLKIVKALIEQEFKELIGK